jgi:hypothetical protein
MKDIAIIKMIEKNLIRKVLVSVPSHEKRIYKKDMVIRIANNTKLIGSLVINSSMHNFSKIHTNMFSGQSVEKVQVVGKVNRR